VWKRNDPRTASINANTARLAEHAFAQMGIVCIGVTPEGDFNRIAIVPVTDKVNADRCLLLSRRNAEVLLKVLVRNELAVRCEDGSVLIEGDRDHCFKVVHLEVRLSHIKSIEGAEIAERIASVRKEIDRALTNLQSTGGMKVLNREYKALRMQPRAASEKIPSLNVWLTQRLEAMILQLLSTTELLPAW
jgi:hypothetical protein